MKENVLRNTMTALNLIVSVITIIDFGAVMVMKYRKPKTVTGFSGAAKSTEEQP